MRPTPSWPSAPPSAADLRASDIVLGMLAATLIVGGSALGVVAAPPRDGFDPIVAEHEIAVGVRPVDVAPSRPGARGPAATDATWTEPKRSEPAPTEPVEAVPSIPPFPRDDAPREPEAGLGPGPAATSVPARPDDAPPPSTGPLPARPRGGIRALPRLAPPSTSLDPGVAVGPTEPGFGRGGPGVAPGPADPATSPDDPYAYVDPALEQPGSGHAGLVGGGGDAPTGDEGDPLAERAVAIYRQRLQRWLSRSFVVTGTGLSAAELERMSIQARIELDADRTLVDYEIEPGGHPAFEAAARRALDEVVGETAPPLPEHYPGPLQAWVRVTFVCVEGRCN